MRVLVAGIGYHNLRDHSLGLAVAARLAARAWPEEVEVSVEDFGYGPIAIVQRLEDDAPERRFARAVFIAAAPRGRLPGTVARYRWDGRLPGPAEIQRRITEAVTGVVSLDNALIVARHFGALPAEVAVVEVEPLVHEFGESLSEPLAAIFDALCEEVGALAADAEAWRRLPLRPLGGAAGADAVAS